MAQETAEISIPTEERKRPHPAAGNVKAVVAAAFERLIRDSMRPRNGKAQWGRSLMVEKPKHV